MNNEKFDTYISLMDKYNLIDFRDQWSVYWDKSREKPFSVGLLGTGFLIPNVLNYLLSTDIFTNLNSRSFCLTITYGELIKWTYLKDGNLIPINNIQEWFFEEEEDDTDGREEEEAAPVYLQMTMPEEKLKGISLIAISSVYDFVEFPWGEILVDIDYPYVLLSATKLLSGAERRLARKVLSDKSKQTKYLLYHLEHVHEEERELVINQLASFVGIENMVVLKSDTSEIWNMWSTLEKDTEELTNLRKEYLLSYAKKVFWNCWNRRLKVWK